MFKPPSLTAVRSMASPYDRPPTIAAALDTPEPAPDVAASHQAPARVAPGDLFSADGHPGWQARFYDLWVADAL